MLNFDAVIEQPVVALVEGPLDCMAHKHAVGILGKRLSPMQFALLELLVAHGTKEFVVSLDSDAEMGRVYDTLVGRVPEVSVLPLTRGDPHDRRAELSKLMQQRRPLGITDRVRQRLGRNVEGV